MAPWTYDQQLDIICPDRIYARATGFTTITQPRFPASDTPCRVISVPAGTTIAIFRLETIPITMAAQPNG